MKNDFRGSNIGNVISGNNSGPVVTGKHATINFGGDAAPQSPSPSAAPQVTAALLLAANPGRMTQLAIDVEAREIAQQIRLSDQRDSLRLVTAWATRPSDLLQLLNQHRPRIVQFSGHGASDGALMLVDSYGTAMPVSAAALEALFASFKQQIRLVVLNACFSRVQAQAISRNIDFVVGMNTAIGDHAAIVFAAALYGALGYGHGVQRAFDQARTALMLENISEDDTPVLLVRDGASPHDPL